MDEYLAIKKSMSKPHKINGKSQTYKRWHAVWLSFYEIFRKGKYRKNKLGIAGGWRCEYISALELSFGGW